MFYSGASPVTQRENELSEQQSTTEEHASAEGADDRNATAGTSDEAGSTDSSDTGSPNSVDSPTPKKTRARKPSAARKTRTVELTLTVTGTAEGEWQAELTHAGKRVVQGLAVPASAVSKAAAELHQEISEAIETVLYQARQQHEEKLAELEAEVERVRKALAELES